MPAPALLRLLQLASPALPIGGYNFSQGLEYAIEAGWVRDEKTALAWISGLMHSSIGTLDVPVLGRLHDAWSLPNAASAERDTVTAPDRRLDKRQHGDAAPGWPVAPEPAHEPHLRGPPVTGRGVMCWSQFLIASRETSELRAEDRHLGRSLAKVLAEAGIAEAREWMTRADATFATLFALACARWGIGKAECTWGYLWAWAENQTLAAVKAVPLGQSAGQRMLDALIAQIPAVAMNAHTLTDEQIGTAAPMHFIASAAHETQYTRLFRS
jgi:urease accessory protein